MANKFGSPQETWELAKTQAIDALTQRAKVRGMMPYSELVQKIDAVKLEAHDPRLSELLMDISIDEEAKGRGMISALVVHKMGDMQPGTGFFELAKRLGKDTSDILACWITEVKRVHSIWSRQ